MIQLTDKVFAVEVPEDAQDFLIKPHLVRNAINERDEGKIVWFNNRGAGDWRVIPHPYFDFLFTTKTATEDQAKKVVERIHIEEAPSPYNDFAGGWDTGYVDYENRGEFAGYQGDAGCFRKSIDSLYSLLRSKGLDDKNNYALIEKASSDDR